MSEKLTVGELVEWMQSLFKTVDFRAVALRDGVRWVNGLTVIRLTRLPKDDVEKIHQLLTNKWGEIDLSGIKVRLEAADFCEWQRIIEGIKQGNSAIMDLTLEYAEPVDVGALELTGYGMQPEDDWPIRIGLATKREAVRWGQFDAEMIRERKGLKTLQALNGLLGLQDFTSNNSTQILVGVPFYSCIRSYDFSGAGCEIDTEFHGDLKGLVLTVFTSMGDSTQIRDWKALELVSSDSSDIGSGFRRMKKTVLLDVREYDKLNLRLVHTPTAYEIESKTQPVRYYLERHKATVDPLLSIFPNFCNYDDLESYLTHPTTESAKSVGIAGGVQGLFENAVSWLLALMGLRVVRLGGTTHERLHDNPMSTTDIVGIGDEAKLVVLVGCTVTDPPDADFDKLIRTRDELAQSIKETDSIITPVLVTPLRVTIGKDRGKQYGIRVLDCDDMRLIINLLRQNDRNRAMEKAFQG